MKKPTFIIAFALLSSTLLLSACNADEKQQPTQAPAKTAPKTEQVAKSNAPSKTVDKNEELIKEQKAEMETLTDELNYYKEYVQEMTLLLPSDKLQELINKEWKYSISINNVEFPKNGILEIGQSDFDLVFHEERAKYSTLPKEESDKGKLSAPLSSSVTTYSPTEQVLSPQTDAQDTFSSLTYSFKGLKSKDVIKIVLTEELSKKMGMSTQDLEIRVK